jgi:S-formylglutathione hydrolase FrmB
VAFCELKYHSKALGKATAADVILPQNDAPGPFAVFYLLHGLSDDHTIWQRRTSIERYVADYPLIVVMPDGGRGFYTDAKTGMAWETALIRDLIGYVDKLFHTRASREGRCIGGLSMGGYGAAKLALKYPDLFCSAVSHSGAMTMAHRPHLADPEKPFEAEMGRIFGEHPEGGPDDLFALAEGLLPAKRPALRIDCGTEDTLLDQNRAFHAHLQKLGYPHEYLEAAGAHEWGYWDVHVQEAIAFHARNLGLEKIKPAPAAESKRK